MDLLLPWLEVDDRIRRDIASVRDALDHAGRPPSDPRTRAHRGGRRQDAERMRVLVVEDDPATGEILQVFLRDLGHEADVVPSAEEALPRLAQRWQPELVLLDFRLPGMSGLDFLRLPLVRSARVPVAVVSGIATEDQARECLRQGAVDFLVKPIAFEHLRRLLECLGPAVPTETAVAEEPAGERRQAPRTRVALPVLVRADDGEAWEATSVDLSVEAMKVRAAGRARPGPWTTLSFMAPEDHEPLVIDALLVRVGVDGYVFYFRNLTARQVERLRRLVHRLALWGKAGE